MKIIDHIKSRRENQKRIDNYYRTMKIDSMGKALDYMDFLAEKKKDRVLNIMILSLIPLLIGAVVVLVLVS
jgi:hypothetical protein